MTDLLIPILIIFVCVLLFACITAWWGVWNILSKNEDHDDDKN